MARIFDVGIDFGIGASPWCCASCMESVIWLPRGSLLTRLSSASAFPSDKRPRNDILSVRSESDLGNKAKILGCRLQRSPSTDVSAAHPKPRQSALERQALQQSLEALTEARDSLNAASKIVCTSIDTVKRAMAAERLSDG
jgi:hypothetical protein